MDIPANVALPELDGALITVPIAAMDCCQTSSSTKNKLIKYEPMPERTKKLVHLAINWGKLHQIANSEKKVAIIFHNYPPRNEQSGTRLGWIPLFL
jgi:cobaltochelatase CobN